MPLIASNGCALLTLPLLSFLINGGNMGYNTSVELVNVIDDFTKDSVGTVALSEDGGG